MRLGLVKPFLPFLLMLCILTQCTRSAHLLSARGDREDGRTLQMRIGITT
jgi:hypothetical protein